MYLYKADHFKVNVVLLSAPRDGTQVTKTGFYK